MAQDEHHPREDDVVAVRRHGTRVLVLVTAVVVAALLAGVLVGFRWTGLLLGAGLVGLAVARLLGPARLVGPLAVRSRIVDVLVALVLAAGLLALSLTTPGVPPGVGPPP
ncbi:DUF3017 domain-containing protein [Pseudokineococcus sp. 1T1Z-3]|uniref:DUF3017 domain-containing protein n=1 Tax=Pseudokineococcus sp. 1T1Z-3 TaxID=3132745 RepID=UPI0030A2C427